MLATLIAMLLSAAPAGAAVPSGKAFSWGGNDYGQLGNNTSGAGTETPGAASNLGGVKSVKAGCDHSLALKTVGTVYSWGDNFFGQLGNGTFTPTDTPGPVSNLSGVKAIATDSYAQHALALLNNGTVRSFAYYSS
jgi:alpha-tubulin suppressor-like RCC1 family protein